jgi:flagellar hook-basal body complex protein FliE
MAIEAVKTAAGAIGTLGDPGKQTGAASVANAGESGTAFADSLGKLLNNTNEADGAANSAVGRMLDGTGDVHEAMIALQQADMMLQLTVQVRNKLVQAYQDIMRMPL